MNVTLDYRAITLLSRLLWAQDRYIILEVKKLSETPFSELSWSDRIRKKKCYPP